MARADTPEETDVTDGAAQRAGSTPPPATIGRRGSIQIAVASLISAGSGYAILTLAARLLVPVEENTVFVTFWSTLFACFGVLSGLSIETTRAVASHADEPLDERQPHVLTVGAGIGVGAGVVAATLAPWWSSAVFPAGRSSLGLLVALGIALYAMHSVVVGTLAGRRSWRTYSRLIAADALVRLALVGAVAVVGATVSGFAVATVAAATTWVWFLLLSPRARSAARTRADSRAATFLRRIGATGVAQGASALLVVGFPVLLAVTTSHAMYATAAPLLLAVSLTRAPLLIPLNAYQGVAVSHFVAHRDRGLAALLPALRIVGALGAVGAVGADLVGPWLLRTLLGAGYSVSGPVLAALTAASALLALLTLTGAMCQALTLHGAFVLGWVTAVAVAFGLLLLPLSLEMRCVLALAGGPFAGAVVHVVRLRRIPRGGDA